MRRNNLIVDNNNYTEFLQHLIKNVVKYAASGAAYERQNNVQVN
jgi:hypothetical protein